MDHQEPHRPIVAEQVEHDQSMVHRDPVLVLSCFLFLGELGHVLDLQGRSKAVA